MTTTTSLAGRSLVRHPWVSLPGGRLWLSLLAAFLVQTAVVLILAGNPRFFGSTGRANVLDDVEIYRRYATRMLSGELPYRDFRVEYPPLALPFFVLPAWVANHSFSAFWTAFGAEMLVLHAANLALIAWWVHRREGIRQAQTRLIWATLLFLPLAQLSVTRFDLVPAFLAFSAAVAWVSGRRGLSGLLAGLGVLAKIVPGVVMGPILAEEARNWRETRLRGIFVFLGVTALGVSAWIMAVGGPSSMRESLRYHVDRGLEIGSLGAGGLMAVGTVLHWPMWSEYLFSSTQLVAPGDSLVASVAFPIQVLAILGVLVAFVRTGRQAPLRFAGAAVLAFVLFGKVLSPQYLLWVYPFVLVVEGRVGLLSRLLFFLAASLTLLLYLWGSHRLASINPAATLILNLRNGVLLGVWAAWVFGPVVCSDSTDDRFGPTSPLHPIPDGRNLTGTASLDDLPVLFPLGSAASRTGLTVRGDRYKL